MAAFGQWQGAPPWQGIPPGLRVVFTADTGSFAFNGQAADFVFGGTILFTADVGVFAFNGQAVTFIRTLARTAAVRMTFAPPRTTLNRRGITYYRQLEQFNAEMRRRIDDLSEAVAEIIRSRS
jgi:hypothetical protein